MITESEVRDAYQKGEQHLKDFIHSEELFEVFQNIRTTYNLHIDHAGNLALALNAIILGVRKFDQFPTMLKEALGEEGTPDVIDKVSREVNDKVFVPLRKLAPLAKPIVVTPSAASTHPNTTQLKPSLKEAMPIMAAKMAEPEKLLAADFEHMPAPAVPPPVTIPTPSPAPQVVTPPTPAVVFVPTPKPEAPKAVVPPAPAAPVKYHGPDPYHEPLE